MNARVEWLTTMRAAGDVKRFHTLRTLRTQRVSQHVYGMLVLLMAVGEADDAMLLQAVTLHDAAELVTGDIPAPAKWKNPELADALRSIEGSFEALHGIHHLYEGLTEAQQALLAWADVAELTLWSVEELRMGNTYALECAGNGMRAMGRMRHEALDNENIQAINTYIYMEVVKHGGE